MVDKVEPKEKSKDKKKESKKKKVPKLDYSQKIKKVSRHQENEAGQEGVSRSDGLKHFH